jgi:hypothetical protein
MINFNHCTLECAKITQSPVYTKCGGGDGDGGDSRFFFIIIIIIIIICLAWVLLYYGDEAPRQIS